MSIYDAQYECMESLQEKISELKQINAYLRQELNEAQQSKKLNDAYC